MILDVYKRQGIMNAVLMTIRLIYLIIGTSLMTLTTTPNQPVSYTHLDVYKRQLLLWMI